jgi:hypothetical protein
MLIHSASASTGTSHWCALRLIVDSKETDLYWHDLSGLCDISGDGKALLFLKAGTRPGAARIMYLICVARTARQPYG